MNGLSVSDIYAEGLRYFMGEGVINKTLSRLSRDLDENGIDYAVIGAVALLAHGYPRFTEDIDLVLTPEGLNALHQKLIGLGYVPARKRLRSSSDNVSIEVMRTGEFPGDGKPKPVAMPDPSSSSFEIDGIKFVTLEKLIELKLASGLTAPDRLKDVADVQELIKIRGLDESFGSKLDPFVRDKFLELQRAVSSSKSNQE